MKATSLVLLAGLLLAAGPASAAAVNKACSDQAEAILAAFQAGDFEQARANFDDSMQAALSSHKLGQVWMTALPARVGAFDHAAEPISRALGDGRSVVIIAMKFDRAWLNLQVACNSQHQVTGLYIKPGAAPVTK